MGGNWQVLGMNWKDKIAVETGGNSGIGEAIAHELAGLGMRVVVSGRREERNDRVAGEIRETHGVETLGVRADVSREGDCRRLIESAKETLGRVDVLVNNAGIGAPGARIADSDTETFDRVMRTNLYSA